HAVEPGLAIHIEPVIRGDLEGTKWFAGVRSALLKVRIKHLFPTRCVYGGGVRDHAVEVEQDGIVCVAGDCTLALGLLHRSLLCNGPSPWPPEEEGNEVSLHDCITGAHTTSSLLPCQSAAPSLTSMRPRTTRRAHVLPSCPFAAAATWSGSKPNFLWSSLSGADAPNVCMPIMRPDLPT